MSDRSIPDNATAVIVSEKDGKLAANVVLPVNQSLNLRETIPMHTHCVMEMLRIFADHPDAPEDFK